MADFYHEDKGDVSPGNAGFNQQAQRASWFFFRYGMSADDLRRLPSDILGTVSTGVDSGGNLNMGLDGRLSRTPPMMHPVWPRLYATNISSVQGIGGGTAVKTNPVVGPEGDPAEGSILSGFWGYTTYRIGIDFTNLPYPIASDGRIIKINSTWFYEGNPVVPNTSAAVAGQTPVSFPTCNEWDRNTDMDFDPKQEAVSAQQGTMSFRSTSSGAGLPDGQIFPGQPRMTLPNQLVRMVWYQVPYRYLISPNSYFSWRIGYVNQNAIRICQKSFKPGELLYLGYKPRKFQGADQSIFGAAPAPDLVKAFYNNLLCDVEMHFLYSPRTSQDVPTLVLNKNIVLAGQNLLPWVIDRKFHAALTKPIADDSKDAPAFYSFPLEVMQYDPDAADALQVASYP